MFAAVYDEVMAACISHTDMTKQSVIKNYRNKKTTENNDGLTCDK